MYFSVLRLVTMKAFSILNPSMHKIDNWMEFLRLSVCRREMLMKKTEVCLVYCECYYFSGTSQVTVSCFIVREGTKHTQKGVLVCTVSDSYLLHRLHCSVCRSFVLYSLFVSWVG